MRRGQKLILGAVLYGPGVWAGGGARAEFLKACAGGLGFFGGRRAVNVAPENAGENAGTEVGVTVGNVRDLRDGNLSGEPATPTNEPNAYFDGLMFGAGYTTHRPPTGYRFLPVENNGRMKKGFADFEHWNRFFPGTEKEFDPNTPVVYVANRTLGTSPNYRYRNVFRFSDNLSEPARQTLVRTFAAAASAEAPSLFFNRRFNSAEAKQLDDLHRAASRGAAELRKTLKVFDARESGLHPSAKELVDHMREDLKGFEKLLNIDIPPNAGPDLVRGGAEVPPVPADAILSPVSSVNDIKGTRYGVYNRDGTAYAVTVHPQIRPDGTVYVINLVEPGKEFTDRRGRSDGSQKTASRESMAKHLSEFVFVTN